MLLLFLLLVAGERLSVRGWTDLTGALRRDSVLAVYKLVCVPSWCLTLESHRDRGGLLVVFSREQQKKEK